MSVTADPAIRYRYGRVKVIRVVDGDTVHVDVDCGLETSRKLKVRLLGINAPEMDTAAGKVARAYLVDLVDQRPVVIETVRDHTEKFGRYLAEIWLPGVETSVNRQMIDAGHAVVYMPV